MNLFLATRALAESKEDHLTVFFAAALQLYPQVRQQFAEIALRDFANANGWHSCAIASVDIQPCYDDIGCRPDMLVTLTNGKRIICEHKLEAPETPGPDEDRRAQLSRYLTLPVDGLLFVRSSWQPPVPDVLSHPKYGKPPGREHFLWRDFYSLFEGATEPILAWLREGFEFLGFSPPHPFIGDLSTDSDRRNFAKLWSKARSHAHCLGYESSPGAVVQVYLDCNPNSLAEVIFIQPTSIGFQFRATPKPLFRDQCFSQMKSACDARAGIVSHGVKTVRRKEGKTQVYDVEIRAADVLGTTVASAQDAEDSLQRFVASFLDVLRK